MIKIYDINDNVLIQAELTSAAVREEEISKSDYIQLSFSTAEKLILPVGAYIEHTYKIDKVREVTEKFLLLEAYEPTQTNESSWKYTPNFQHPKMILSKTPFYILTQNSKNEQIKQSVWSFVGTTSSLSEKIADFLNNDIKFGKCGWVCNMVGVTANTVNVSFSDNDFISALSAICNAIGDNCEWHIDYDNEQIYIGKVVIGSEPVVLEVGKNIGSPSVNSSRESYYNAFSVFGGSRNITQVNEKGENISSGDIRLQLSAGTGSILIDGKQQSFTIDKFSTIDLRKDKEKEPQFTKILDFSDIFPSLNTYAYNVRGREKYVLDENNKKIPLSYNSDGSVKEYKTFTVWYMRLAYPTTKKVSDKTLINTTVDNGVTHYWYDFEITDNLLINGKNIGCSFEANFNEGALSTPLAGRGTNGDYVGFELTYHDKDEYLNASDDTKKWVRGFLGLHGRYVYESYDVAKEGFQVKKGDYEIIYQDDNDVIIPSNADSMLIPRGEDKPSLKCNITVLYNIAMDEDVYIKDAKDRLLEAAKKEIIRLLSDLNNYSFKSYPQIFAANNPCLQIGQNITYKDGNGYTLESRVLKLSTNIDYDFVQEITVGNQTIKGTTTQLREDVQKIIASGGNNGGGTYTAAQMNNLIAKYGTNHFLSKKFNDTAQGVITFLKGLKVGDTGNYEITSDGLARLFAFMTTNFNSGLYGQGASIDNNGAAELDSLFVRKFISTPKFVFNEISVTKAEQWNTNGFGTIESVDTDKRQITLKLEENDYGSLAVGDICRGIFADIDNAYGSDSIEEGAVDDCNFVTHKGFFTTYFYVRRIITAEKGKFVFEYGKRSKTTPDPCAFMDFAQYGSFTDKDRMSSMYFCSRGRSYIEVLDGVKTWEVQVENRVARYGYLGNLRVKRKDGTYIDLKGNGLFAQNNVYFGDNIFRLENISNLDELENIAASYDVTLSQYQSVLTVDDMGNVINGLYTEDEGKSSKQYRISTAVFVRKGTNILLEEDEDSEDVTEGHYRLSVVSNECSCEVLNSTVFVTGIKNVKDGVLGSDDDENFDYDAMRKMTDCMVTIVVDLEGKTSKTVQMPIRIQHDSLPFMVCDLSNEHAAVSWHTKHKHYAGLPIQTMVNMFYKNEPYEFGMTTSLPAEVRDFLVVSVSDSGKSKVLTIDKKGDFSSDVLPTSIEVGIYCVSDYAGAKYEYTKKLSVSKTADAVIYEIVPSANSVKVNSKNEVSPSSVGCEVWATSSDDKRYQVTALPAGFGLYYQKNGGSLVSLSLGTSVSVAATDKEVAFVLKHTENGVEYIDDKEGVPVVADGKNGLIALCSDNLVSIATDVNGKVLATLNESLSFRLFAGEKELTVSGISINASPTSKVVTASVSGNTLKLSCAVGADFGKYDMSYIIKVDGKDGSVAYSSYVAVKVVPNVMGKSIISVNTYYALNSSATSQPGDSAFTYDTMGVAVIASNADKYLWSGDKIIYSDGTTAITGIYLVGKCSELASVTEQYAKTTTPVAPASDWSDTYPSSVDKGYYIWSRDKITWKDGYTSYSSAQLVGYIGKDGKGYEHVYYLASSNSVPSKPYRRADGSLKDGWSDGIPSMDSSHGYIFVSCRQGDSFAESSQDGWSMPVLYARLPKSIESVNTWYELSSSIITPPSSYGYDTIDDLVISSNADKYLWSADKVIYTDGSSEFTGAYCLGKCIELTSVKEQYGTSSSSGTKPTSWSDTYPSQLIKGTYIWTRDFITWKDGSTSQTDAQLAGYIGTDGAGQVVAYKRAASIPNYTPSVTAYDTYQSSNDLGSGWTKSAPSSDDSLVSGGSVSGVSANNNTNGGTWSSVADGGYNWYKSPSVADNGIATMRIYFTTSITNQYVTFYLRAYSENNYDFVLISAIDSTSLTRDSGYTARVSGNGSDTYIRLKCSTAGQHFVTIAYAKDVSGSNNGDYGLVRMATSENYISQSSILYRCDGSVEANIISWGSIYQVQGDKGDNGDQGVGISSVITYYLISSLSSGVSTSTSGWSTGMVNPTSSKPYLWSYAKTILTDGTEENSTPVIIGNFAEAGPMGTNGCIVRNSIWKSGVEYRNDSALTTDGVKYLDYVYVENSSANDGWDKYVCSTTHTSASYNSPTSSYGTTYWTKLSDAGPIYSPLIVAKNAVLKFAQTQQLNLMNGNDIWGSLRNPSGTSGDESKWALWLGGSTASSAPFRVDKDGNAYLNSGVYEGSMRSPFKGIGSGFDNILTDNISIVGALNVNFSSPKLDYVGRLVHFVNHRWNYTLQSGVTTLKLPSGYYFYEDGVAKSSIQVSRECVTLLGLGDESRFYGWLVLDRVDIETSKKYGHDMKCLAYGMVIGVTSGNPSVRYKTFDGSTMTASRTRSGVYRISCPSSWFDNDTSNVFVQLTGVGHSLDSSKKIEPIKATLWSIEFSINAIFIEVHTSDDETENDGSFNFMISNFDDFSYLS